MLLPAGTGQSWTCARGLGVVASARGRRRAAPRRHRPRRRRLVVARDRRARPLAQPSRVRRPATARCSTAAASSCAEPAPGAPALDHVRRHLLPGRRLARRRLPRRPRGLLLPAQLRRHRPVAHRRRARAGRRGDVLPRSAARAAGATSPACSSTPRPSTGTGTRAGCGDRCASTTPARSASIASACCAATPTRPAPTCGCTPGSTATWPRTVAPAHDAPTASSSARPSTRWRPASNEIEWSLDIDRPPAVVAARARRAAADRHRRRACSSTARSATAARRRTGLREVAWNDWVCSVNGERLFLKGANLLPTRPGLGRRHRAECGATSSWPSRPASTRCACRPTSPTTSCTDAADELGMLLLQDFPLQWGYARSVRREAVRQAREAVDALGHHPSIVQWCAHDEPVADAPSGRGRLGAAGGSAGSSAPAAADVEQVGARPLGEAGVRAGRPDPPDVRPPRRRSPTSRSSTAPTATSGSAGTAARSATSPSWPA